MTAGARKIRARTSSKPGVRGFDIVSNAACRDGSVPVMGRRDAFEGHDNPDEGDGAVGDYGEVDDVPVYFPHFHYTEEEKSDGEFENAKGYGGEDTGKPDVFDSCCDLPDL